MTFRNEPRSLTAVDQSSLGRICSLSSIYAIQILGPFALLQPITATSEIIAGDEWGFDRIELPEALGRACIFEMHL